MPKHCPNTFTEEQVVSKREPHNCLDTYGRISRQDAYSQMDQVMVQLRQHSGISVVFYLSSRGKPARKQINARIRRMLEAFALRKGLGESGRIAFIVVEDKEEYTRICYFSESMEKPDLNGDNVIKGTDVDLRKLTKSKKPKK